MTTLSWRIDFKNQARHVTQLNTPVAIVEMKFQNPRNDEVWYDLCLEIIFQSRLA